MERGRIVFQGIMRSNFYEPAHPGRDPPFEVSGDGIPVDPSWSQCHSGIASEPFGFWFGFPKVAAGANRIEALLL